LAGKNPRRLAVAAARVDDDTAPFNLGPRQDAVDHRPRRISNALPAGYPEAVVDVESPDLAVEAIECVVVTGDERFLVVQRNWRLRHTQCVHDSAAWRHPASGPRLDLAARSAKPTCVSGK